MPQIFKIGSYSVYFWSNENDPIEPVHVHISEGRATAGATKVWITSSGKALLANNNSHIPKNDLGQLLRMIEANSEMIVDEWYKQFKDISFFC